jgi:hydrogenase maturation protease
MLDTLTKQVCGKQTVILGIGNILMGDDAIGPNLVDLLSDRLVAPLINAGEVLENYLDSIRAACTDVVLIIVAIELGAEPGDIMVMYVYQLRAIRDFTRIHGLAFLTKIIQDDTGAEVILIGIQPEKASFASELNEPVQKALHSLEDRLMYVY